LNFSSDATKSAHAHYDTQLTHTDSSLDIYCECVCMCRKMATFCWARLRK